MVYLIFLLLNAIFIIILNIIIRKDYLADKDVIFTLASFSGSPLF
jgi:hypothetical protein